MLTRMRSLLEFLILLPALGSVVGSSTPNNGGIIDNQSSTKNNPVGRFDGGEISNPKSSSSEVSSKSKSSITQRKKSSSTTTNNNKKRGGVISSQASGSLARIRKEYMDAVASGMAYNWVDGKRIQPKKKKKRKKTERTVHEEKEKTKDTTTPAEDGGDDDINDNDGVDKIPPQLDEEDQRLICLGPLTTNLRHWHFSFRGVSGGLYDGGIYHGRIMLPKDYPMSPPRIQLWTPSGRFKPYEDICLSASAYHPESWTPRWTVIGLIQALRLHMLTPPREVGGMPSTPERTLEYARASQTWTARWWADDGKTKIYVDHQKLVNDGALTVIQQQQQLSSPPPATQPPLEGTDGDTILDVSTPIEETSIDNEDVSSVSAASLATSKGHARHEDNGVSILETMGLVPTRPIKYMSMAEPRRADNKLAFTSKVKTKKSTKKGLSPPITGMEQKSSKQMRKNQPSTQRLQESEGDSIVGVVMRTVMTVVSEVLSSPVPRFVLATLLLLWLLNRYGS